MHTENTAIEKINNLVKNSVTLKLVTITTLMLLLLIPASMIKSIIEEREQLNQEATNEVSSRWANAQQIHGPILTIPVMYEYEREDKIFATTRFWHVLPEHLNIEGNVVPQKLKRGIYEVVVYRSVLHVSGAFTVNHRPDPQYLKEILFDEAFLTIGISDLRGIKNQVHLDWNGNTLMAIPGSTLPELIYSGITIHVPDLSEQSGHTSTFDFTLDLRGSKNIAFVPTGNTTVVHLKSPWQSPSFNGNFLPDSRTLSPEGFTASWSVLQLNRNFPQTWMGNEHKQPMQDASFGVDLIVPLDDYQKAYRSAKYAVMTISLTFLIFFLVEILSKKRIHPFQYALVGLALCLFYVLLISISEHSGFRVAYAISTVVIVFMISLYSLSVFKQIKLSLILVALLAGIYGFLFATLQLADYALLMGSIGLTLILGLTMYCTRNVHWYGLNMEK